MFSDLDGTLLDRTTYSWEAARGALNRLKRAGFPLVLVTSKTRRELEWWRKRMGNHDPFVAENGGAVYIPAGYFGWPVPGAVHRDGYEVLEFGTPYEELVRTLLLASARSGVEVRGFHELSVEDIAERCGMPPEIAALAKEREYDEPFEPADADEADRLGDEIRALGKRHLPGGRFHHITGDNDKGRAVRLLTALFRKYDAELVTVGAGDAWNDVSMLNVVDLPVLLPSLHAARIGAAVPRAHLAARPGPCGWSEAMLAILPI